MLCVIEMVIELITSDPMEYISLRQEVKLAVSKAKRTVKTS